MVFGRWSSSFEWLWSFTAGGEGIEWRYFTSRKRNRALASRRFELKRSEAYPCRSADTNRRYYSDCCNYGSE
nr:MAG TPA: hypothetical protein [Caudoviricetes sp.]